MLPKLQYAIRLIVYWHSKRCFFPHYIYMCHDRFTQFSGYSINRQAIVSMFYKHYGFCKGENNETILIKTCWVPLRKQVASKNKILVYQRHILLTEVLSADLSIHQDLSKNIFFTSLIVEFFEKIPEKSKEIERKTY